MRPASLLRHTIYFSVIAATIAGICAIDIWTGPWVNVSLFYLGPIGSMTWVHGPVFGTIAAGACLAVWQYAEIVSGAVRPEMGVDFWNLLIRTGYFAGTVYGGHYLRQQLQLAARGAAALAERARLQQFTTQLQAAREGERLRIARDVHDGLGQSLTAIHLNLHALHTDLERATTALHTQRIAEHFACLRQDIAAALTLVRRITSELRPTVLNTLGLTAAIEWLVKDFHERTDLHARYEVPPGEPTISHTAAIGLFRILQEALTNIIRHARATTVTVAYSEDDTGATLHITDNGRGMSPDESLHPDALGLLGMRERAESLHGHLTIDSRVDHGTRLTVHLPRRTADGAPNVCAF